MAVANIEAIQSVPPNKVTETRSIRHVSGMDAIGSGIFKVSMNIVLYYDKVGKEESGWEVAGWIKESLARAFSEEPLLGGRLIRKGEDGNNREFEIVSNDSGARLVEAKVPMTLQEFLGLEDRAKSESGLVFWKDIDEMNPEYSPLFYVQVSNFQCGGYSIGISCSLLLADLVIMHGFIQKWGKIHLELLSKPGKQKVPFFYLPNLKSDTLFPPSKVSSTPSNNGDHYTMIFKATRTKDVKKESTQALAFHCIEEAESKFGKKVATEFFLLVKELNDVIMVENFKRREIIGNSNLDITRDYEISVLNWEDLGSNHVCFIEGNKPVGISCWIGSTSDGLVVAVPHTKEEAFGVDIIVKIPK